MTPCLLGLLLAHELLEVLVPEAILERAGGAEAVQGAGVARWFCGCIEYRRRAGKPGYQRASTPGWWNGTGRRCGTMQRCSRPTEKEFKLLPLPGEVVLPRPPVSAAWGWR